MAISKLSKWQSEFVLPTNKELSKQKEDAQQDTTSLWQKGTSLLKSGTSTSDVNAKIKETNSNIKSLQKQKQRAAKADYSDEDILTNNVGAKKAQSADAVQSIDEDIKAAESEKQELQSKKQGILYNDLKSSPDFALKSKYTPSSDDVTYNYINGDKDAKSQKTLEGIMNNASFLGLSDSYLEKMNDDEIATFNYIYNTSGKEKAYDYIGYIKEDLTSRQRAEQKESNEKYAEEHPVKASAWSVLTSPLKGISYLGEAADYLEDGKIDTNAGYNKFSANVGDIRSKVSDTIENSGKWGKVGSFLYQTGMSMGDFLLNSGVAGGNEALSLAIMGTGAAADATREAKNRGLSDSQSFTLGTIAGLAEIVTEKVSVEALFKSDLTGAKYLIKNVVSEGSEEVASDLINLFADIIVSKDKAEWNESVKSYEDEGFSRSKAVIKAIGDQALNMGVDFAGGALSGGIMASPYAIATGRSGKGANSAVTENFKGSETTNVTPDVTNPENANLPLLSENAASTQESNALIETVEQAQQEQAQQPQKAHNNIDAQSVIDTLLNPEGGADSQQQEANLTENGENSVKNGDNLTLDERKAALNESVNEYNKLLESLKENGYTQEQFDAMKAWGEELAREYDSITQQERVEKDEVSKNYGKPENHIDNREYSDMAKRSIKSFQFDHPELHSYYVEAANALLEQTEEAGRSEKHAYGEGTTFNDSSSVKKAVNLGLSRPDIIKVCKDIIADSGQENYAAAKRVEIILDDMLSNGFTDAQHNSTPKNTDYIKAKEQINGAVKEGTWEKYKRDNDFLVEWHEMTEDELYNDWLKEQRENNSDGGTNDTENNTSNTNADTSDGLGAADAGFTKPEEGKSVPTQDKTQTQGIGYSEEFRERLTPENHEQVSEQSSLAQAAQKFYEDENGKVTNLDTTVDELLSKEMWTGADQDAAQAAFRLLLMEAQKTGDWSKAKELHEAISRIGGTEVGRSLQARKKWVDSGAGMVSKVMGILSDPRIPENLSDTVLNAVSDFADQYDRAVESADINGFADIIIETAKLRNTIGDKGLSKLQTWALNRVVANGDIEFLRNMAYSSVVAMAQDQVPTSLSEQVKALRRDAMLSKASTTIRNLVANNVFDPIDSISRNISVPFDIALSQITGTRSVSADGSWFSSAKRKGSLDGFAKAALEVALDVSSEGAESTYGATGNRTFKMSGGPVERLLSRWEKSLNYAMYSTDQFQKGGIDAEVQTGTDALYDAGKIADDSLKTAGQQEALYRTFQQDSGLSKALLKVRQALNTAHIGNMGLGDIVMPFVQVPANIVDVEIDYTPLGLLRAGKELMTTFKEAKAGTLTAAQQANAVQKIGKALNGTGLIALSIMLRSLGVLSVADSGKDEDSDKAALEKTSNISGTQVNVSLLSRILSGDEGKERQNGDTLVSLSYLDPINALLTIGSLIYDEKIENGEITVEDVLTDSASGIVQSVMDLPMMSALSDASTAYQYSSADTEGGRWIDAMKQYAGGQVSSFIPNSIKGIAQGIGENQVNAYTSDNALGQMLDSLKASIPGLRQTLPTKVDSYGNEVKNDDNELLRFLNSNVLPGTIKTYNQPNADVTSWLDELYEDTGKTNQYPSKSAPKSVNADLDGDGEKEKISLTYDERKAYQKAYGDAYLDVARLLKESSEGTNLTSDEIIDILVSAKSYAAGVAQQKVIGDMGGEYELSSAAKTMEKALTAVDAGIGLADYFELKDEHDKIASEDGSAYDKMTEWSYYLDSQKGITEEQISTLEELLGFSSGYSVNEASTYDKLKDSGLKASTAKAVYDTLSSLTPKDGASSVSNGQKYSAIAGMDMTDEEKLSAIKAIDSSSNQSTYNKYAAAVKAGISVSDWSNLASSISGTVSQAKLQEALKALGWSKSKCSAAWDVYSDANGWKKENPYK